MKILRTLAIGVLALVVARLAIRELAPLPTLEGRETSKAFTETDDTRIGRAIADRAAAHPGLSGIFALPDPQDAFAARVLMARAAERSIDAQYYIWHSDLTGSLLFNELRAAADRGVRVRLLLDDNTTAGLDPVIAGLEAHRNIEVRLFNPFPIRKPRLLGYLTDFSRLNRRMHNKSFTVDNQATVVGGRNIGDEYFGTGSGALFVDLDVIGIGPVVNEVSSDFDRYWASGSSYPANRIVTSDGSERLVAIAERAGRVERDPRARQYVEAIRNLPFVEHLMAGKLEFEWVPVQMVSDDPAKGLGQAAKETLLYSKLHETLGPPSETLGLVSGYFVPAKAGTEAFVDMARRGVEVTIFTNALEATDVPIVHSGYAKWRKPLLEAGVRLFEMRGPEAAARPKRGVTGAGSTGSNLSGAGSALHAKTFAVDGRRIFVGSFNFDPRSRDLNTELGFVIESPKLAGQLRDALGRAATSHTYEVRLSDEGELYWIERRNGQELRYDTEPGTTVLQRASIELLSMLPIEWLL